MMEKKEKLLWGFRLGRIIIYLGLTVFLLSLTPGDTEATRVLCLFRNFFQVACPSCGATERWFSYSIADGKKRLP